MLLQRLGAHSAVVLDLHMISCIITLAFGDYILPAVSLNVDETNVVINVLDASSRNDRLLCSSGLAW